MSIPSFCKLAHNIFRSNFGELPLPYRMTFILTSQCQLRCQMCNIWAKDTNGELSLDEISKFFDHANHLSWINLSGGEIFLRNDIDQIFEIILSKCRHLHLLDFPTNGFKTDAIVSSIKKLIASSVGTPKIFVTISLDGPPEVHAKIRNNPIAWQHAVETFKQLRLMRSKQFNVYFGMTLQNQNMTLVEETVNSVNKTISSVSIDDFHFNVIHHSEHYYDNEDMSNADTEKLWKYLSDITNQRKHKRLDPVAFIEKKYQSLSKTFLTTHKSPILCQASGASFFMDPMGKVFPCSIYNKIIGNIRDYEYNLKKLWATSLRQETRKQILKGKCPQCWTPCEAYQSILGSIFPKKIKGE